MLNYSDKRRTLEEVKELLKTSLSIEWLRGKSLWQVKLTKVQFLYSTTNKKLNYAFIRNACPNIALNLLCRKLSTAIVIAPDKRVILLGEVIKGPLYVRLFKE